MPPSIHHGGVQGASNQAMADSRLLPHSHPITDLIWFSTRTFSCLSIRSDEEPECIYACYVLVVTSCRHVVGRVWLDRVAHLLGQINRGTPQRFHTAIARPRAGPFSVFRTMRRLICLHYIQAYIDGFVQNCSNSIAIVLELLQCCTKTSIFCEQTSYNLS